jgi:hypothetical protein
MLKLKMHKNILSIKPTPNQIHVDCLGPGWSSHVTEYTIRGDLLRSYQNEPSLDGLFRGYNNFFGKPSNNRKLCFLSEFYA